MRLMVNTEKEKLMLNNLVAYIQKMFEPQQHTDTYGAALEAWIVRHNPQSPGDVDRLVREFDRQQARSGWTS